MWKQAVEKAKTHRRRQGDRQAMAGQTFKAPSGFDVEDGREEPPPAQAGVHRRGQGRRPVQRRVEDEGPGPRPAVEPVHPRQREEGRRLDLSRGSAATARRRSSGRPASWRCQVDAATSGPAWATRAQRRFSRRCVAASAAVALSRAAHAGRARRRGRRPGCAVGRRRSRRSVAQAGGAATTRAALPALQALLRRRAAASAPTAMRTSGIEDGDVPRSADRRGDDAARRGR